jgi:5-methylcytosine-specific restriction protein A
MNPPRNGKMDRLYPKRRNADGNPLCRYCGNPVVRPRRWWCSDACVDQAKIRCWPAHAAAMCFDRDHHTCRECGVVDPRHAWSVKSIDREQFLMNLNDLKSRGYDVKRAILEAHHVMPVKAGGGTCGLDNLVTLCQLCHNLTKKLPPKESAQCCLLSIGKKP